MKTETASEAYARNLQEAKRQIKALKMAIKTHEQMQKHEPLNWGYVGDIAHVCETAKELEGFINSVKTTNQ